jgi:hypothetical protein
MVKKKKESAPVKAKSGDSLEKVLIENSVALQKAVVNLSVKLDNLAEKISKLLDLFEVSAKSFMEKGGEKEGGGLSKKIDSLLEQNKTFAKGIAMLYEKPGAQAPPMQGSSNQEITNFEGYQHSMQMGESANVSSPNSRFKSLPKRENA